MAYAPEELLRLVCVSQAIVDIPAGETKLVEDIGVAQGQVGLVEALVARVIRIKVLGSFFVAVNVTPEARREPFV